MIRQLLLLLVEGLRIVMLCLPRAVLMWVMEVVAGLLLQHLRMRLQRSMHSVASVYPLWAPFSETTTSRSIMDWPLQWKLNGMNLLLRTLMRVMGMNVLLLP